MIWLRITTLIPLLVTTAWLASRSWSPELPWDAIAAAAAAACAYAYGEYQSVKAESSKPRISDHDRKIGEELRNIFSERSQRFLREADFGTPFRSTEDDDLDGVFYRWEGVDHEFEDGHLQAQANLAVSAAKDFLTLAMKYSGPTDRRRNTEDLYWLAVPSDEELASENFAKETWDNINELRRAAADALAKFEEWERSYRRLLPRTGKPAPKEERAIQGGD